MKTVLIASALASAAAFAPAPANRASTELNGLFGPGATNFGNEIGAQAPVSVAQLGSVLTAHLVHL